ncbi:hypothetical protein [Yaravirus sp. 'brasiliensis']|uniref:Uncharacterized protein n=1 Tax=Yaravirus sp. 'brasiliensis' TaxID=2739681 RepID=A0AAE7E229_9VIRU|nr:hypothetical protein QKS73_gp19 [Yaravirus brasiliensis]QKE44392.1 hypothetical protein [Yaravirus brasiliensis]
MVFALYRGKLKKGGLGKKLAFFSGVGQKKNGVEKRGSADF